MQISTAALILDGDRLLLVRRPEGGALSECWELPGGKADPGETPPEALRRELAEELGIDAEVGHEVAGVPFRHGETEFELRAFRVTADLATLRLHEHTELCWRTPRNALALNLAPSDRSLLCRLLAESAGGDLLR